MKNLNYAGFHKIKNIEDTIFIIINKYDDTFTLFKIETASYKHDKIIKDLELMLKLSSSSYLEGQFIKMSYNEFINNYEGFLGFVPPVLLNEIKELI